jgi:hypothetical protein
MPVIDKKKIQLGLGALEFGAYTNDVFGAYEDVGAIKSRLDIMIEREVLDFETGRPLLVVKQDVVRERVSVRATLAEIKLANIKAVLGQGVLTSSVVPTFLDGTQNAMRGNLQAGTTSVAPGTLLKFGGLPTHAYIGLRFTHARSEDEKRTIWEFYKASPTGSLGVPFNETDWNLMDVEFRVLADTTKAAED